MHVHPQICFTFFHPCILVRIKNVSNSKIGKVVWILMIVAVLTKSSTVALMGEYNFIL